MAILSGKQILKQRELGDIVIEPFNPASLGENSYDLRLGNKLLVYDLEPKQKELTEKWGGALPEEEELRSQSSYNSVTFSRILDMKKENETKEILIPEEGYVLSPGVLYLGHTVEYTETKAHVPIVEGRSSVGRLGLKVHFTAGFGDRGFKGDWTLEIEVVHPLRVYAGVRVCQIFYHTLEGTYGDGYHGKYQDQRGPKASGMWRDFLPKEPK